tara:strand:- start:12 stop:335 length:324 start_codon:yes stop_codon:yes gene_type:complete
MNKATVVDARLDKLEQDNRRLKLTVGALLLVLAAVPLIGAVMPEQIPEVIRAGAFHAIDGNGTLRALMDDKNIAYLDEDRVTRAQLYAAGFFLSDENGNVVWRSPEH